MKKSKSIDARWPQRSVIAVPPYNTKRLVVVQRKVGQVLKRVAVGREWLVVEREGYPVAVMFPYPDLEQLKREQAAQKMRVLLSTMGTNEYSEAEVDADIAKAISEVRHEKRQKNKKT